MTLNNITVKNFQSIKDGEVNLGNFTVFTGPSSSGKSAFLRAAQATARNSFNPSQVRQGSKETHVTLEFDDHVVEAIRGKSKSTYILDGKEFTKAGRQVPQPVEDALRMGLISDTESSFSTQFDKPYLIAEPGSTAAKVLGSLTNVSILHNGLRESNRRGLETNSQIKTLTASLEENRSALREFDLLEVQRDLLDSSNSILSELKDKYNSLMELTSITESIQRKVDRLQDVRKYSYDLNPITESLSTIGSMVEDLIVLTKHVESIEQSNSSIPKWNYKSVPSEGIPDRFNSLGDLHRIVRRLDVLKGQTPTWNYEAVYNLEMDEKVEVIISNLQVLDTVSSRMSENVTILQQLIKSSEELNAKISEIKEEYDSVLTNDFEECPLCGNSLHEKEKH